MIEFVNEIPESTTVSAFDLEDERFYVLDSSTPEHVKKMVKEWKVQVLQSIKNLSYLDTEAVLGVWLGSRMILTEDSPCVSQMRFREVNLKVEIQNV